MPCDSGTFPPNAVPTPPPKMPLVDVLAGVAKGLFTAVLPPKRLVPEPPKVLAGLFCPNRVPPEVLFAPNPVEAVLVVPKPLPPKPPPVVVAVVLPKIPPPLEVVEPNAGFAAPKAGLLLPPKPGDWSQPGGLEELSMRFNCRCRSIGAILERRASGMSLRKCERIQKIQRHSASEIAKESAPCWCRLL